jgi:hypothetical protein
MMHEMHHSVLLAQWSAEVRHTLTFDAFFYTFAAYLFNHTLIALLHSLLHLIRRGFEGD